MVFIVVLLIIGINIWIGYTRGFIRTVFTIFSLIAAILLSAWISPFVGKWMQNNDKVMDYFTDKVGQTISFDSSGDDFKNENTDWIQDIPLPKAMKDSLEENLAQLYSTTIDHKIEDINQYAYKYLACIIINALAFIITFLVFCILLWILCRVLDIVSKLPILNQVNKLLGLLFGIVHGFLIVWLLCILLTTIMSTDLGYQIMKEVNESSFLSFIYNNNLLIRIVTDVSKVIIVAMI